jgi:hypothetical protein
MHQTCREPGMPLLGLHRVPRLSPKEEKKRYRP